jgi:nitrogen-specific signal transduction histidine kinase
VIWFLVWTLLALAAAAVLSLLGRRLWRQARELTREMGEAADRLSALTDRLAEIDNQRNLLADELDGVRSQGPRRRH